MEFVLDQSVFSDLVVIRGVVLADILSKERLRCLLISSELQYPSVDALKKDPAFYREVFSRTVTSISATVVPTGSQWLSCSR